MAQTEAEVTRKTDTIMAQADKDGDGVVTFDGESRVESQSSVMIVEYQRKDNEEPATPPPKRVRVRGGSWFYKIAKGGNLWAWRRW